MKKREGQVMILTVLTLGATLLGATTIAGLLMLYQVRQATDLANSSKAIFAADAGTEWAAYQIITNTTLPPLKFTNGATVAVTCYDDNDDPIDCSNASSTSVRSIGTSGDASRALCLFQNCN